jgi:hypothetical protein
VLEIGADERILADRLHLHRAATLAHRLVPAAEVRQRGAEQHVELGVVLGSQIVLQGDPCGVGIRVSVRLVAPQGVRGRDRQRPALAGVAEGGDG